ncbi:hypothetical protein Enr10x_28860 [Gimesia panareensis]|uniref:Uncharacterized protein n=1 Tax=Gimesia panareensis TaxID=2527978 RepID=A0A517Q7I8_9PLAN|nr:hypothetical protein [Gimesia panareensis]QDT27568.1 hypothetical protein Enr10x_28860 [Gimesia panareensis]
MSLEDLKIYHWNLTLEYLEMYPVWGAFDDDDSEIIRPVTAADPFTMDCDPLTIKSDFKTPDGLVMLGCILCDCEDAEVNMVEIFFAGNRFPFSTSVADLQKQTLQRLQNSIRHSEDPIFPLYYQTHTLGPDGKKIEGYFSQF